MSTGGARVTSAEIDSSWAGTDSDIASTVLEVRREVLGAYGAAPELVKEHANIERSAIEGGYGRRQLYELIQNGADALLGQSGRIEVVLTDSTLYCANAGSPLTQEGTRALLFSNLSAKQGEEIGRFGLGFKSVLGITRHPEIFSRSGSLRFNPPTARAEIEKVLGRPTDRIPTLRIAEPIDPYEERDGDPVLDELMEWSTTVVRLSRDLEDTTWLPDKLREFPREFLLFSRHVNRLDLRDLVTGLHRSITTESRGDRCSLREGADASDWRIFSTSYTPSTRAKRDGGTMADRDEIPITWAVDTRRRRIGEFWAYFPTYEQTTLSGILNAPWKLNEDRTRLIDGPFNEDLLNEASDLVLDHLEHLSPEEDPGQLIDLMPGRGRESRGWADGVLTEKLNRQAAFHPSVPDQDGELGYPSELELHPPDIPRLMLDAWAAVPGRPKLWVHPSVETRERRPRVEMYMEPSGKEAAELATWLEAIVGSKTAEASAAAVRIAAGLILHDEKHEAGLRGASFILNEAGSLVPPDEHQLFIRAPLPIEAEADYVHPDLAEDEATREALEILGIHTVDAFRLLAAHVKDYAPGWKAGQWDTFWDLVRKCGDAERVTQLLADHGFDAMKLVVRSRAGKYVRMISLFLPGDIVQERSVEDAEALVDTNFHSEEMAILRHFGAASGPTSTGGSRSEPWFVEYHRAVQEDYLEELRRHGAAPSVEYLEFRARKFAGPATPLRRQLSPGARMRLTHALIQASNELGPWTYHHRSQSRYPERGYSHPIVWLLERHGLLRTSLGAATVKKAVGPRLSAFRAVLPVADIPEAAADALGLPQSLEDLSTDHWDILLAAVRRADDERILAKAYLAAVDAGVQAPEVIRCRVGKALDERAPASVAVTADEELAELFRRAGDPHLHVPHQEDADRLIERWALRTGREGLRSEIGFIVAGEDEALIDLFPMLRHPLPDDYHDIVVIPCSELREETYTETGQTSVAKAVVVEGRHVYRHIQVEDLEFLGEISTRFGLGLEEPQLHAILRNVEDQKILRLKDEIRGAADDAERLLTAIGERELRERIPASLIEAARVLQERELGSREIAELALAAYGVEVLQKYRDVLESRGLNPPTTWAGRRKAVDFVSELGFDPAYAGFERARVEATIEVEGRPEIPPLHEYQEIVVADIRETLEGAGDGLRGILSLPTGAGKTRVTVEALVSAMAEGRLGSPILWIAQTEELCEQAVQTWSEIWRGIGPRRRLTVSRLWSHFEATPVESGDQVVVATIAKLDAGVYDEKSQYGWLKKNTAAIVVDEAHTSIGQQYTRMLEWQGMARNVDRIPLIGLTATPFRNTNVEETKRLIARYGNRRLDQRALGGSKAYPRLQELGILSEVDHELLEGQELQLTADELASLERLRFLPQRAAQRLGEDAERNARLLEHVLSLPEDWPVLMFATSVEHAQVMAALLTREGVPAAAIYGETERGARRHYIQQFRDGAIRVLTNFNVLTAGFDAPKVRALYIARPTYSPNAYQQMVGRGLRGPRNGGTERCLLVNVADNVLQFGEGLAFHEFEYLWSEDGEQSDDG